MKRNNKIYIIKIKRKVILAISIIVLFICSVIFFNRIKAIDIFCFRNQTDRTIVIDPGHGGIDGGTNDKGGFLEKKVNLDIGLKLKKELEKEGFNVIMTREKDVSLEEFSDINASRHRKDLDARKNIINQAKPIVFVSIHVNSNISSKEARGVQIYYHPTSEDSKIFAETISYSINEHVYNNFLKTDSLKVKVLSEDFFVLRETSHTGILIEAGFMTNPIDKLLLESEEYQGKIAFAIKEGLKKYIEDDV